MRSKSFQEDSPNLSSSLDWKRSDKSVDDPVAAKSIAQCSVISTYYVTLSGTVNVVTVTWCKSLINHSLTVSIDRTTDSTTQLTCKIELKPWPFWSKKGFKSFDIDSHRVDVFWDLRSAKFSGGPEPTGGYYVAMVCSEEVVLLLGDCKKEAYKRTKSRPSLVDPTLVSKKDNVFGKKCFSTRARFDEGKREHDIVVENSLSGPKDPEMWISVDGIVLLHVSNLQWKFRGNETVLVERVPVQVFWDVHDWLFSAPGSAGHALFIFKPGTPPEGGAEEERRVLSNNNGSGGDGVPEFCFFLCAWRLE